MTWASTRTRPCATCTPGCCAKNSWTCRSPPKTPPLQTIASTSRRPPDGADPHPGGYLQQDCGQCHRLTATATTIGRLPDNHLVLPEDAKVSRRHAIIVATGAGFVIHDTGSANGVELNGHRITASAPLNDGDHLRIGATTFTIHLDSEVRTAPGTVDLTVFPA
jgi:hypothetical protein